jgi:hypothetical protein
MLDNIERTRLKMKMLDRWENEGGRIATDSMIASQSNLANQREGDGSQAAASNNSSRLDRISSRQEGAGLLQR